jgi:hypothetical protein
MADSDVKSDSLNTAAAFRQNSIIKDAAIQSSLDFRYDSFGQITASEISTPSGFIKVDSSHISIDKTGTQNTSSTQISIPQIATREIRSVEEGSVHLSLAEVSFETVSSYQSSSTKNSLLEIGTPQSSTCEIARIQNTSTQIGTLQISSNHLNSLKVAARQIDTSQISIDKVSSPDSNSFKIPLSSSITLQQLLSSHNPNLQNTTVPTWTEFLQSPTPFNLKIEIQDLPTGQLAEATITGYDTNNRPNSGTLTLDTDGNSLGWFIDTTPDDNTEFDQTLTTTAYRATTGAASGKYDLLTTILHELGHLNGIIRGNTAFDTHVQNINGIPTFIDGGITATLTPDGSHLDPNLYPYDLMNTSLKPGVRKLPPSLDLSILNTLWSNKPTTSQQLSTTANLTAGALIGITNTPTTWNTAGATNIINGTATLTEQSQKLSELTQAFIIPTGAKTLQFTITDNHLIPGDTTLTANDAFVGEAFALAISRPPRHQHPQTPSWNQHRTQPHRLSPQHPSQRHHLQEQQSNHHRSSQQQQHRKYRSHPDRPNHPSHPLLQPPRLMLSARLRQRSQNQHHHN